MPFVVRVQANQRNRKRLSERLSAADLVQAQAAAVTSYLGTALKAGFAAADGEPRPRKGDGKPRGYDTGYLSRSIRASKLQTGRARAAVRIDPPSSRAAFVAKQPDVITVEGNVADRIRTATTEYLETLTDV